MKYHRIGKNNSKVEGKNAAGIFFTDGQKVLMLKRSEDDKHPGTWAIPGGKSKKNESDIGAAIRETKEETGLESIPGYRFEEFSSKDGRKRFRTFLYRVREPFDVSISAEHTDWEWMNLDSLDSEDLHPRFRENLPRFLKCIRRKVRTFSEWSNITFLIENVSGQ